MRIQRDAEEPTYKRAPIKTQTQKTHIKIFGGNTKYMPCIVDPDIWVNC
jgi:hypothetical protein